MSHVWQIPSVDFLGLRLSRLGHDEVMQAVDEAVSYRAPLYHAVLNASKVVTAGEDVRFKGLMNSFDLVNADGMSVVWASRVLGLGNFERITGIDLMQDLVARAATRGYSVYFLGATDRVLARMMRVLTKRHPELVLAGAHHGYFRQEDEPLLCQEINETGADLLFVGTPSPMKERFLIDNRARLAVPFAMGVGGSFDVLAGAVRRAPALVQSLGMEWAFRLVQEPRRLWRRYLHTNSQFMWRVARARLGRPKLRKKAA